MRVFHEGFIITDYELEILARSHFEALHRPQLYDVMCSYGISRSDDREYAYLAARLDEIEAVFGKEKLDAALEAPRAKLEADYQTYKLRCDQPRKCAYCGKDKQPVEEDGGPCEACLCGESPR